MIDPTARWAQYGEKPDYAGLLTFAGVPYTEDPAELAGFDAAIIGAPMDELVSDSPGARFAPRAIRAASCPPGPHMEARVDAIGEVLKVVDFGDAPIVPADPVRSHEAIRETVTHALAAGVMPIILGGDHSIAEPDIRACADVFGPVGLVHFDTHTDTGTTVFGAELSHGTPMYRLVEAGIVDGARYAQVGLRGYWPGEEEFGWQRERGIRSWPMHDVRDRGIRAVIDEVVDGRRSRSRAGVPLDRCRRARSRLCAGHRHARAGGMTSSELLWAAREVARRLPIVGADVVEVLPSAIGSKDITALVAERTVREILTGVAMRKVAEAAAS